MEKSKTKAKRTARDYKRETCTENLRLCEEIGFIPGSMYANGFICECGEHK